MIDSIDQINIFLKLNSKSEQLEAFLSGNNDVLKPVDNLTDKKAYELLEKSNKEQEKLIKGYQSENERLYAELKQIKEHQRVEQVKFNEEIKSLKCDLIQERINAEKQVKSSIELNNKIVLANISNEFDSKKIMPTNAQSLPILNTVNEYETEIRNLTGKLHFMNEEHKKTLEANKTLHKKVENFVQTQRQIELDINVINAKNKEIKKLNDKLKLIESGKSPVECMREIKSLKNQLVEMDSVVRRLKKPLTANQFDELKTHADSVSMSIDFYEKKIEQLEAQLKEKDQFMER